MLQVHVSDGVCVLSVSPCQSPLDEPVVLTDEVIFPLTVSLDKLPVSTLKVKVRRNICRILCDGDTLERVSENVHTCWRHLSPAVDLIVKMQRLSFSSVMLCCVFVWVQVMVTVWKREAEKAEVQELGYLSVLQQREPTHTFRHDLNTFKAQGTTHTFIVTGGIFLTSSVLVTVFPI